MKSNLVRDLLCGSTYLSFVKKLWQRGKIYISMYHTRVLDEIFGEKSADILCGITVIILGLLMTSSYCESTFCLK